MNIASLFRTSHQPRRRTSDAQPATRRRSAAVPSVSIMVHRSLAGLETVWRTLEASADCYAFQTWDWNRAWYECVGRPKGVDLCVIQLLDDDGTTRALWPLGIYPRRGLRVLAYLGERVSDYRAPLLFPGWAQALGPARFQRLWRECLASLRRVDVVMLERMPEHFGASANPMAQLRGARPAENAYLIHLPDDVDDYLAGRSTRLLAENRRKVRRLRELGDFRVPRVHDAQESHRVFAEIVRQKSRRWRETGSHDLFADQAYLSFYEAVTRCGVPTGFVAVSSMQVNRDVVAAHWGLVFRGRYYGILTSFAAGGWRKYSCGELLVQFQIQYAIDAALKVFDLTVGEEAYKKTWATDRLALYQWRCARSVRGHLYLACVRFKEAARRITLLRRCVQSLKRVRGGNVHHSHSSC
ncbi:GNAT family N-acetyltransferase [Castellaniella caeni]|uniref:GNAT family N-acetyltransferase n=1 Tax=Castellaniella caeni TaxID=266123 RepID=UPI00083227E7|nr:GNAT family N-acetyltransferase [Castellaniella caeni]